MAQKSLAYDHPTYTARTAAALGEAGGTATTQYAKFVAFAACQAFSAQLTVTTAGTTNVHGFTINKISGTATTALATQTIGTAAAGTTYNVLLTSVAGGVALAQGDMLTALSLTEGVGKAAVAYEYNVQPLANVTA